MKTLIYDEEQVKKFYNEIIVDAPHSDFDVDFFCVAARKKYMTQEEKEATKLGDTCMMEKTVVRELNEEVFLHKLQKVDSCLDHLYSHNGTNIPRSCMVLYMNVNHTSMINAIKSLKSDISLIENELYDVFIKNGPRAGIANKISRLDQVTLKAYQNPQNVSKKCWIDIDMDISVDSVSYKEIEDALDCMLIIKVCPKIYKVIQTHGGYHILVNTISISSHNKVVSINYEDFKKYILSVKDFTDTLEKLVTDKGLEAKEIKINQNSMVPIPGTLQGGHKVILY